jgi:ketosteroid isomerase-like protein
VSAGRCSDPRVARIVDFFERLTPADLARLDSLYTADARFKDPFNEVQGVAPIERIFRHMFDRLEAPHFVIHDVIVEGAQCFLTWDFVFRLRSGDRRTITVHGGSHLRLAADGRVELHRDYWDVAEELYEKLPLVGALMRWLKRRAKS